MFFYVDVICSEKKTLIVPCDKEEDVEAKLKEIIANNKNSFKFDDIHIDSIIPCAKSDLDEISNILKKPNKPIVIFDKAINNK